LRFADAAWTGKTGGVQAPWLAAALLLRTIEFRYPKGEAKDVRIAGDMTDWRPVPMTLSGSLWRYTARLKPDQAVEYKFLVDGEWRHHPDAPVTENRFGTLNNVYQGPFCR
jgi:1,4-alpha-glucan branching enzyme